MKTSTFSRSKNKWQNDEAAAQRDVCQAENLQPDQLTAVHTTDKFSWTAEVEESQFPIIRYPKTDLSEPEAIRKAMSDLDTFEGNLKTEHTDDYFRFTKVRG